MLDGLHLIKPANRAGVLTPLLEFEMAVGCLGAPRHVATVLKQRRPATLHRRVAKVLNRTGVSNSQLLRASVAVLEFNGEADRLVLLNCFEGPDVGAERLLDQQLVDLELAVLQALLHPRPCVPVGRHERRLLAEWVLLLEVLLLLLEEVVFQELLEV